ncbi:MAG: glycosyltransferase family 2 protein [Chloroflexi bacterium]|nr:glycosyltransferase family 2 protein [Chloroflexota bacterium]
MKLSIIIVSWNVKDYLSGCLISLGRANGLRLGQDMEVIVVDNASTDGTPELVTRAFPRVRLVCNTLNRGFAAANNQGIAMASGRYLLLLNPDTEVVADALVTMEDYFDGNPDVGVLGPQLLNSDGSIQSSRRRDPTLATLFVESTILQRYLGWLPLLRRYYCLDRPDNVIQEVDWLVGAAIMVRREAVAQVGPLREEMFMYFEEVDWCCRMRDKGWHIIYLPEAKVYHHDGRSSIQDVASRDIRFHSSKIKFVRSYHGDLVARLLRWFLLATYLFQIGEEGFKLALRHKPEMRRRRLQRLFQVMATGLRA